MEACQAHNLEVLGTKPSDALIKNFKARIAKLVKRGRLKICSLGFLGSSPSACIFFIYFYVKIKSRDSSVGRATDCRGQVFKTPLAGCSNHPRETHTYKIKILFMIILIFMKIFHLLQNLLLF